MVHCRLLTCTALDANILFLSRVLIDHHSDRALIRAPVDFTRQESERLPAIVEPNGQAGFIIPPSFILRAGGHDA